MKQINKRQVHFWGALSIFLALQMFFNLSTNVRLAVACALILYSAYVYKAWSKQPVPLGGKKQTIVTWGQDGIQAVEMIFLFVGFIFLKKTSPNLIPDGLVAQVMNYEFGVASYMTCSLWSITLALLYLAATRAITRVNYNLSERDMLMYFFETRLYI